MQQVIDDQFGPDVLERLDRIERNTDVACKIAKDTQVEHILTQSKVDRHDIEIKQLQSFAGFATT